MSTPIYRYIYFAVFPYIGQSVSRRGKLYRPFYVEVTLKKIKLVADRFTLDRGKWMTIGPKLSWAFYDRRADTKSFKGLATLVPEL